MPSLRSRVSRRQRAWDSRTVALTNAGFRSCAPEQCFPTGELSLAQEVNKPVLLKHWFGGDLVVSEKERQVLIPMFDL